MKLCFATNNEHKLSEVQQLAGDQFEIIGLKQIGHHEDIPEDFETMEENSMQKARYIKDRYGVDCFADDSGLEVNTLNGAPGVYSARYAGPQRSSHDNNMKLLSEMDGATDRSARFKAVISLITGEQERQFEGIIDGKIITTLTGTDGFGYDPLFIPNGHDRTFAEMSTDEKNEMSHRAEAVGKLVTYLQRLQL